MMREGCERESWDRLAYWCATYASGQGAKNVRMEQFHKFDIAEKEQMSKEHLHSLKNYFEE